MPRIQNHAPNCDHVIKAHLLLSGPYGPDIDALGAVFMASIGLNGASLKGAQKDHRASKLVLRTDPAMLLVAKSETPLGAAYFNNSIPPRISAAERSAFMAIISHHEAAITLKLRLNTPFDQDISTLLHQAVKAVSPKTNPLGLLWGPTQRLHQGGGMRDILESDAPMELFLAPVFKANGTRKTQIIDFAGARHILGFELCLHMIQISRQKAIDAGLAFASHCIKDPTFHTQRSFQHHGQTFRLTHNDGYISLIPVAYFHTDTTPLIKTDLKTAA